MEILAIAKKNLNKNIFLGIKTPNTNYRKEILKRKMKFFLLAIIEQKGTRKL